MQEAFARAYVENGGNASEAYRKAGYSTAAKPESLHVSASRLLAKVMPRIEQLQAKHQKRHDITVDRLTEMAVAAYDLAMDEKCNAPGAAVSALLAIGKLHGLVVDKKEVTRKRDATDLSLEELYTIAGMGRARDPQADASAAEPDRVH
tara:strand:- start:4276 stop:4722 length:447 start_codon:yes stop_codon:yes gene_type:complete